MDSNFNPFRENSEVKPPKEEWEMLYTTKFDEETKNKALKNKENKLLESEEYQLDCFQVDKKYIVTNLENEILIINLTRAHQRILYEYFLESLTSQNKTSQQLLFPIKIGLPSKIKHLFKEISNVLNEIGFIFEKITTDTIKLIGVPTICEEKNMENVLEDLFDFFEQNFHSETFSYADSITQSLCKSLAIKAGITLSNKEQQELIKKLFSCKEQLLTPFNKKIYFSLNKNKIEKNLNNV